MLFDYLILNSSSNSSLSIFIIILCGLSACRFPPMMSSRDIKGHDKFPFIPLPPISPFESEFRLFQQNMKNTNKNATET